MEKSGLRENEPKLYEAELKRIRDLHNSFATAFEKGEIKGHKKGKIEGKIEIAKKMIIKRIDSSLISVHP